MQHQISILGSWVCAGPTFGIHGILLY
jgi:hypothetical protein